MNERIRELIHQTNEWMGVNAQGDMWEREQKFAELIVIECMKLNRDILCEDDPDYLDKIYKEHFGVEE